ncbi:hypothetical protein [Thermus sp.]|uniref:hypothetical protein n=1 Tax=Thermus sp. TaxID=275 RepID=UPI00298EFFA5|nr:hypothetical protein [Thermus sp.]MDW8357877.1 hypothetical protein [Thermus sp.]
MHDTTRLSAIIAAFKAPPELAFPPAQGVLFNRVASYLQAAWEAAAREDWPAFVEAVHEVYLAGLMDGPLPLGVLLAGALMDQAEEG